MTFPAFPAPEVARGGRSDSQCNPPLIVARATSVRRALAHDHCVNRADVGYRHEIPGDSAPAHDKWPSRAILEIELFVDEPAARHRAGVLRDSNHEHIVSLRRVGCVLPETAEVKRGETKTGDV